MFEGLFIFLALAVQWSAILKGDIMNNNCVTFNNN